MKAARQQLIAQLIETKPFISLRELEEYFPNVTSMTLRRDIEFFEKQGALIKVRGGARSMKFISPAAGERCAAKNVADSNTAALIAAKAVAFTEIGHSYFVDSGKAALYLAEYLPDEQITVITSGPEVACELAKKVYPTVVMCGGTISRDSVSVVGQKAMDFLSEANIDVAFLTAYGYSTETGFTCGSFAEGELKKIAADKAQTVVILIDSSKLDKSLPYTFCDPGKADILITDKKIPLSLIDVSAYPNLNVVLADAPKNSDYFTKCLTAEELEALKKLEK